MDTLVADILIDSSAIALSRTPAQKLRASASAPIGLPQTHYDAASPFVRGFAPALSNTVSRDEFIRFVDALSAAIVPNAHVEAVRDATDIAANFVPGIGHIVSKSVSAAASVGNAARVKVNAGRVLARANEMLAPRWRVMLLSTANLHRLLGYTGPGSTEYAPRRKAEDAERRRAYKQTSRDAKMVKKSAKERQRREKKDREERERREKRERKKELRAIPRDQRRAAEKADKQAKERRKEDDRARKSAASAPHSTPPHQSRRRSSSSSSSSSSSYDSDAPRLPLRYGLQRLAPYAALTTPVTEHPAPAPPQGYMARQVAKDRDEDRIEREQRAAKKAARGELRALDKLDRDALWLVVVPSQA